MTPLLSPDLEPLGVEAGQVELSPAEADELDLAWKREQKARDARRLSETVQMEWQIKGFREEGGL